MNIVKLQVTKWVERTGDKENNISDLVNYSTGRNNRTLPLYNSNLPQSAIIYYSLLIL